MRKDIREGVKKYMIDGMKLNFSALAKQYDCDYRTVKAAYTKTLEGDVKFVEKNIRSSKLDSFKTIIEEKLKDQRTAYSIYKFIVKKGFTDSYNLVKKYTQEFKNEK